MEATTLDTRSGPLSGLLSAEETLPGLEPHDRPHGGSGRLTFVVAGKPLTWQRARQNTSQGFPRFFVPVDRENHMSTVRDAWRDLGEVPFGKDQPIGMRCEFYFDRPAAHFRANGLLKDWAFPLRPGRGRNGGDLDNLVKLVKDALNQVAYHDDTQIAELEAAKLYVRGGMPCTVVSLWPLIAV